MKIFLSVGHSIMRNGSVTSADGRSYGGCLEYEYCKNLVKYIEKWLVKAGHNVTVCIVPERKYNGTTDEFNYKIPLENKGNYDLSVELHLNAFNGQAYGTEVYYKTNSGKKYAQRVVDKLGTIFRNRGAQLHNNLAWLNRTKAPAILIEHFFCDSKSDYATAKSHGYDKIGKLVAEGIHGKEIMEKEETIPDNKVWYRVQVGAFRSSENAKKLKEELEKKGYEAVVVKA